MGMGFGGIMRSWMLRGNKGGKGCHKSVNYTYIVALNIDICYSFKSPFSLAPFSYPYLYTAPSYFSSSMKLFSRLVVPRAPTPF